MTNDKSSQRKHKHNDKETTGKHRHFTSRNTSDNIRQKQVP